MVDLSQRLLKTISLSITMVLVNYVWQSLLYARFMNYDISKTLGLVHYLMQWLNRLT